MRSLVEVWARSGAAGVVLEKATWFVRVMRMARTETLSVSFDSRITSSGLHGLDTTHLRLVDTTRFGSGIVVLTYTPK